LLTHEEIDCGHLIRLNACLTNLRTPIRILDILNELIINNVTFTHFDFSMKYVRSVRIIDDYLIIYLSIIFFPRDYPFRLRFEIDSSDPKVKTK
jgi:hypothetical protein